MPSSERLAPPGLLQANNVFFYYTDLDRAARFYTEVMGFDLVADYGPARIFQIAATSFITLVDMSIGMHTTEEPKSVMLDCVVDDVESWYAYLVEQQQTPLARALAIDPSESHDGFVVYDPEGYTIEIERFNPHPANATLSPILASLPATGPTTRAATQRPDPLTIRATVIWLYYKDVAAAQRFLGESLGLEFMFEYQIATLYRASASGFLGTVAGDQGMHPATDEKAVTLSLLTSDIDAWFAYIQARDDIPMRTGEIAVRDRYKALVTYAPENYFLEFNTFLEHPDNEEFLRRIQIAAS